MKHRRTRRKLNDRQARITIICVAAVIVLLVVALVVVGPILGGNNGGHYEGDGHDHGHYEGDGHNHGTPTANSSDKVSYRLYTNADSTYRVVFLDNSGKTVKEVSSAAKQPVKTALDADAGIYELSWATGQGPNDYESIYYNVKTGQVSEQFRATRGCDGVRVAYGSADQTKVIVQDVFDKNAYYHEHALENGVANADGDIIVGGKLREDKKTVVISYVSDAKGTTSHAIVKLYE